MEEEHPAARVNHSDQGGNGAQTEEKGRILKDSFPDSLLELSDGKTGTRRLDQSLQEDQKSAKGENV